MASEDKPTAEELVRLIKDVVDKARLYGEAAILFSDTLWRKDGGFDYHLFNERGKADAELHRAAIAWVKANNIAKGHTDG